MSALNGRLSSNSRDGRAESRPHASQPSRLTATSRAGGVCALSLLLCLAASACAGVSPSSSPSAAPDQQARALTQALEDALATRNAAPGDPARGAAVVDAALNAGRASLAYEEAQKLRELDPEGAEPLRLLGHACYALGLFEEAAASFFASLQKKPSVDATHWLVILLRAKGREDLALEVLEDATRTLSGYWILEKARYELMPTQEDKVAVLEAFLQRSPDHTEAAALLEATRPPAPAQHYQKITQGANEVIRARLKDFYDFPLLIGGEEVYTRLNLGGRYLILSEVAVEHLKLRGTGEAGPAVGGLSQASRSEMLIIPRIQLGNLVLEHVPALVVQDFNTTSVQAIFPTSMLKDYSWRLDRKREVMELYPLSQPLPAPSASAVTLPYYSFDGELLTEAVLSNGRGQERIQGKVYLDTGYQVSILNRRMVEDYKLGRLNTTQTITLKGIGYGKAVFAQNARVHMGGATFLGDRKQEGFYADTFEGRLQPLGILGRDVLSRFLITVDAQKHQVTLETYE